MTTTTMSAEERARDLFFGTTFPDRVILEVAEQIRQAEQAAYERAANVAEFKWKSRLIAKAIRALAQESEEVG